MPRRGDLPLRVGTALPLPHFRWRSARGSGRARRAYGAPSTGHARIHGQWWGGEAAKRRLKVMFHRRGFFATVPPRIHTRARMRAHARARAHARTRTHAQCVHSAHPPICPPPLSASALARAATEQRPAGSSPRPSNDMRDSSLFFCVFVFSYCLTSSFGTIRRTRRK